ncbi:hypothetical protein [Pseudobythopirellula maris]|uniref:hypothetical protein n=1 Tax=Pseudobythopirellula maris TaxID=2527991 RepID=UPI0011B4F71B|nr:hypothetical protein [Pseudobythopirellula maris]
MAAIHFEGFEDPGWAPGGASWNNFSGGSIQRVASGGGIAGVASASGSAHAEIYDLQVGADVFGDPSLGARSPYTQFGGYSSSFGSGFTASLAVYLDPAAWTDGQGFDYSVAVNNQSGVHLRDFIFHVGKDGGDLKVNASNNTDLAFNAFKLNTENAGDFSTVTGPGWYSLEHAFYNVGGFLTVDFNLLDAGGTLLHSITRTTSDSIATTVGGNRYGYMAYNNIEGLAIDNTSLSANGGVIPEATAAVVWVGLSLVGGLRFRQRGSVKTA